MRLRSFETEDAVIIASWIKNEREFRLWSADRFGCYPFDPMIMVSQYSESVKTGAFFPVTVVDDEGNIIGRLILRYTDEVHKTVRFGFVIVDRSLRGRGTGREMLALAKKYAAEVLHAERISLGVFECNEAAAGCYRAAGFTQIMGGRSCIMCSERHGSVLKWKCSCCDGITHICHAECKCHIN
jgi:RimJ/RimL family protein N-acetyltransferase